VVLSPAAREARRAWRRGLGDRRTLPWPHAVAASQDPARVRCNVCGWRGQAFRGTAHCESAVCPVCGSIGRDRFLYWCWTTRTPYDPAAVVLETSPRLDAEYRTRMARRVRYITSDFDESAHRGAIRIDLERIDLPSGSLDVVLTPHVLEHVPDTDRALSELFRVVRPGGSVLLQVPLPQARTAVPPGPEYHGDSTLVHWRFGWDLAETVRRQGFACDVLVPEELHTRAAAGQSFAYSGDDIDVDDLMGGANPDDMTVVATDEQCAALGLAPAFQFVTLHLHRP
jgi:SAM-dependent methyltransferase